MIEIFDCDQCGNAHQKFITIIRDNTKVRTNPQHFDSIDCAVNFLMESKWNQYKIDCTTSQDAIGVILSQINLKKKLENDKFKNLI